MRNHRLLPILSVLLGTYLIFSTASASLVGRWTFDEAAGTQVADSSGRENHGTLINPKPGAWTEGISGGALHFDGTTGPDSSFVEIPDAPSLRLSGPVSFAAWIRSDDIQRDAPIMAKEGTGNLCFWFGAYSGAHFGVLLDADGNYPWNLEDRDQGTITAGLWVHVASTWDGNTVRHYLNGMQLAETTAFSQPLHVADNPLILGSNFPFRTTAFHGVIDEVRLYDHALTLSEVRELAGVKRELVAHWPLDEGTGTQIADLSSHQHHGTLINAKPTTWVPGIRGSALYFDGTTGTESTRVEIPDATSLRIAAEISFAAWVRCEDLTRDAPILAKEGDGHLSYWFGVFGASAEGAQPGNFGVLLDPDGAQPWSVYDRNQGAILQGEWTHLASTWDGSTVRHYLDGESLAETVSFPGPIHVSTAPVTLGVNSLYNYTAFKGAIDEVRLYSYALSPEEVRALFTTARFRITAFSAEGDDLRLTWTCTPGREYVVQTNAFSVSGVVVSGFADATGPIPVPTDWALATTNYLHRGALASDGPLFYRLKLLP